MVLIGTQCKRIFLVKRKQIETVASRGSEDRMKPPNVVDLASVL
jgi:hypothetical protein